MEWLILYHGYDTWAPLTQYKDSAMSWVNIDLFDCRVIQPKKFVVWLSTPAIWKASSIKIVLWFYHWTSCQQRLISKGLRIVPPLVSIKQIKCVAKQSLMEAHIGSTTWNPIAQGLFIQLFFFIYHGSVTWEMTSASCSASATKKRFSGRFWALWSGLIMNCNRYTAPGSVAEPPGPSASTAVLSTPADNAKMTIVTNNDFILFTLCEA